MISAAFSTIAYIVETRLVLGIRGKVSGVYDSKISRAIDIQILTGDAALATGKHGSGLCTDVTLSW